MRGVLGCIVHGYTSPPQVNSDRLLFTCGDTGAKRLGLSKQGNFVPIWQDQETTFYYCDFLCNIK